MGKLVLPRVQLGQSILRTPARKLSKADILSQDTYDLVQSMFYTLRRTGGVGLAAPQIGRSIQLAVINVGVRNKNHKVQGAPKKRQRFVMINPKIISASKSTRTIHEGCLSFVDLFGEVARPSSVKVEYTDLTGVVHNKRIQGLVATVFQHEMDHLQGVLWIDRATDTTTFMTQSEYRKMKLLSSLED